MPSVARRLALAVAALLVAATPWPLGALDASAQAGIAIAAVVVLVACAAPLLVAPRVVVPPVRASVLAIVGVAFVLVQLTPLPLDVVAILSPDAADAARSVGASHTTISVDPDRTWAIAIRLAAFSVLFVAVAHAIDARRATALFGAVVATAVAVAGYAAWRWATGTTTILGHAPSFPSPTPSGPFANASHLAACVGAAIPLAVAASCATQSRRQRGAWIAAIGILVGALLLTRSRSGGVALAVALGVFGGLALAAWGARPRTLVRCALLGGFLLVGAAIAGEIAIGAAPGALDWSDRVDLYRSGLAMLAAYPLVGCGLGAVGAALPRFQSTHFGDRVAMSLHGDWLELACGIGLVGAMCVVLVGIALVRRVSAGAIAIVEPRTRWHAIGGIASLAFLVVQAAFDATLLRVPAIGIVAVVVGASVWRMTVARTEAASAIAWRVPMRLVAGACVVAVAVTGIVVPIARARAEIAFHRHLVASGESGAREVPWTVAADPAGAEAWLAAARRHNPLAADPAIRAARAARRAADRLIDTEARRAARALLGIASEPATVDAVARSVAPSLALDPTTAVADALARADAAYERAIRLAPTRPLPRLERAALAARRGLGIDADAVLAAIALGPTRVDVRYRGSMLLLADAADEGRPALRRRAVARASRALRAALATAPERTTAAYDALAATTDGVSALVAATPRTVDAHRRLIEYLGARGAWRDTLVVADRLAALGTDAAQLAAARARCLAFGRLGRWDARAAAERTLVAIEAPVLARRVARARARIAAGHVDEAADDCRAVLAVDPVHVDATLVLADTLRGPRERIAVLARLIGVETGDAPAWRRVRRHAARVGGRGVDGWVVDLLDAWCAHRLGRSGARARIERLAARAPAGPFADLMPRHGDATAPIRDGAIPIGVVFAGRVELVAAAVRTATGGERAFSTWWRARTPAVRDVCLAVGDTSRLIDPEGGWRCGVVHRVDVRVGGTDAVSLAIRGVDDAGVPRVWQTRAGETSIVVRPAVNP